CKKAEAQSMLDHTIGYEVIDGKLHWESVDKLYALAKERQEKAKAAGRASAKARADKNGNEQP
ncbi:hypothetical protein N9O71_01845, partial [bacterium]|nr:hypothetical protein [bacterium]